MDKLRKTDTLLFKFAAVFLIFTIITLAVSGIATFITQTDDYRDQCGENIKNIGRYLSDMMTEDSEEVCNYRRFFLENFDSINDIEIPIDFTEYHTAKHEFDALFEKEYPGRVLGVDISFDELSYETKAKYFTYVYEKWVLAFEDARTTFGIPYTYFAVPNADESKAVFLIGGQRRPQEADEKLLRLNNMYMDTEDPDDPDDPDSEDYILFFRTYHAKEALPEYQVWDNEYGKTYTYFTPLNIGQDCLGIIGTEVDVAYVNKGIVANALKEMTAIAVILVVCSAFALIFINLNYIKRLEHLESGVREYASEKDPSVAEKMKTNAVGRNEISSLSLQTAEMVRELDTYISDVKTMTAEKVRMGADLNVATKIQADMLPRDFFPNIKAIDVFATMDPAKEVGGDFYDLFRIDSDHIGIAMADVSGKGVPAALFMVVAKTLIQDRALMGRSPARVLEYSNNRLCANNNAGLFVTAWLGVLEISTGLLTFANAGHEYPAFRSADGKFELRIADNAPPLAAMEDMEYEDEKIILDPGDCLFLYTDGVPEAKNEKGERFGTDKMLEILNKYRDESAKDILGRLKDKIDEFDGDSDPFDDVTMMCLKYFGKKK